MRVSALADYDFFLFHEGTNYHAYEMLGAHSIKNGVRFAVWAPKAKKVSVVGDFNNWKTGQTPLTLQNDGETWAATVPDVAKGNFYKFAIEDEYGNVVLKADPYAFFAEKAPGTASVVYFPDYEWNDDAWQRDKQNKVSYDEPMLIYEVHLGSWKRSPSGAILSYKDLADELIPYMKKMHYTHLELMPLCEYPFDGSWGYQVTGYYAATSRYGVPEELMYLIDRAHQNGISVIMDWVPGYFCNDGHGLKCFDGDALYESADIKRSENAEWGATNFDYNRTEVQSFLISNAFFWLEEYHLDGLRIDAVANMLYLDYARKDGEWEPNKYGGNGNLEAEAFLKKLNTAVFMYHPQALMMAEESTAWPLVTKPSDMGGLGFNYKWNMGWMNDMLTYMSLAPQLRKENHEKLTFSLTYAFSENFILPLSHDEVVHGKRSLISKMPGEYGQQFAGLRSFFACWMAHPGKKLLFMGGEFGQFIEWNYNGKLDWQLTDEYDSHRNLLRFSRELNEFYVKNPSLWHADFEWRGFEWIDHCDNDNSVISFLRREKEPNKFIIIVCNFATQVWCDYRIGVPARGNYKEVFNTDNKIYGGSGMLNEGSLQTEDVFWNNREQSLTLTLAPLTTIYLEYENTLSSFMVNGEID